MNECGIVVCEKTGRWAVAIRRALGGATGLGETRSWTACLREARSRPGALVAVEITPENAEAACLRLTELSLNSPQISVIVLADRRLRPTEWVFREAGAVSVLFSPDELVRLRPLWQRFVDRLPVVQTPFREQVWSRLPWTQYATGVSEKVASK